jgi:hypothetical protein
MLSKCKRWLGEIDTVFEDYKHIETVNAKVEDITSTNIIIYKYCSKNPYNSFIKALNDWNQVSKEKGMDINLVFSYNCNSKHTCDSTKNIALELLRAYNDFTK